MTQSVYRLSCRRNDPQILRFFTDKTVNLEYSRSMRIRILGYHYT